MKLLKLSFFHGFISLIGGNSVVRSINKLTRIQGKNLRFG